MYPAVFVRVVRFFAVATAVLALTCSAAFAQIDLRQMVSFGDSLTDNQSILPWYTGVPSHYYGHDPFELIYDLNAGRNDRLSDYAVAGSTSGQVGWQIGLYNFNVSIFLQRRATLFQLEMGGNDILNNDALLARYAPGRNAQADAVINNLIGNWRSHVVNLRDNARSDARAIFWTIPDVTVTPRYYGRLEPWQTANIQAHTERANQFIRSLGRFEPAVVLDLYALTQDWIVNPPRIGELELGLPPLYGETWHLFADEIHPTAVSNGLIANEIIALMNEKWNAGLVGLSQETLLDFALNGGWVPTPGTAAIGLLLAVGVGRRRRRAA